MMKKRSRFPPLELEWKNKKFFYPYLHQLNQIFNETDKHEINGLKSAFVLNNKDIFIIRILG